MKKALSIILALCLVISLVPSAFAAESNTVVYEPNIQNYVMNSSAFGAAGTFSDTVHSVENNLNTNARWGYVNHRTGSSYGVYDKAIQWSYVIGESAPSPYTGTGDVMLALEIEVTKKATYQPTLFFERASNAPCVDVYLFKKPDDGDKYYRSKNSNGNMLFYNVRDTRANDRIGTVDTYGERVADSHKFDRLLDLDAGRYFLVFIPNGASKDWAAISNKGNTFISGFELAEVKETEVSAYEYITTFDAFNISKMFLSKDGTYYSNLGFYRNSSGDGNIIHNFATMDWETVANVYTNVDGVPTKTDETFKTMKLDVTDPWKMSFSKANSAPCIKGKYGLYMSNPIGSYHSTTSGPFVSLILRIPYGGTYKLSIKSGRALETNSVPAIWFGTTPLAKDGTPYQADPAKASSSFIIGTAKKLCYFDFRTASTTEYNDVCEITVPKGGDYYLSFIPDTQSRVYNTKATDGVDYAANFDENGTLITNPANSKASQDMYISGLKLTPVRNTKLEEKEDEISAIINEKGGDVAPKASGITTTANVAAIAAYIDGEEITGEVINTASAAFGKEIKLTAPKKDGYKFLYWAKAGVNTKTILSHSEEIAYIPYHGANRVIAVYENESAAPSDKAEFYNANGQLIATLAADGKAPALPSLAGFGNAKAWALYGSDKLVGAGDDIELSGTMLFVAQYDDLEEDAIEIEINGKTENYTYGETVTVTATARSNNNHGSEVFNYWEKDGEAVSFDLTYSFKATADAKIKAVYKDYKPVAKELRKIILTKVSGGYVFAEFIGLEKAVEKGILFGGDTLTTATSKVTMSGKDNQLAVYDDVEGEGTGYALMADGTVVYDK